MESTTPDYNYDYDDDNVMPAGLCTSDGENLLGAQLSTIYYFMFLFSLFGNGLVLVIIHRFEKLTTVTNILLLNLVVSSLIFMSSLPFVGVYKQLSHWIFGEVMCKIVGSVYYLGLYSSVLFLTLLTFDRHLAVVYSVGGSQVRNQRYALLSCAVVWLVSGLACIPKMILHTTFTHNSSNKTLCQEYPLNTPIDDKLRASGFYLQLFLFLLFPLIVIVYCYVRIGITVISSKIVTRFKTVRLIFVIVLFFFICWTPFNVVQLIPENLSCEEKKKRGYAHEVTHDIAYIYFCISPIFYTFVGKKFQSYFRQLLVKRFPGLKKHISVSQVSRTNMSTKSTQKSIELS
ncbi:C-C chemokine receptor type 1-like [Thunnus albacares]|uniref:C-C chemokine receptor type 1-like n=1 Tax=Thunnus albacares TaxID=8236 RepID=UPI001CF699A5|nr:C-C chemokine receptor type 1-like [Thunnus albacares]XP_044196328.1 C-C chemokine receptor type 1-like [Thunnus albacares]